MVLLRLVIVPSGRLSLYQLLAYSINSEGSGGMLVVGRPLLRLAVQPCIWTQDSLCAFREGFLTKPTMVGFCTPIVVLGTKCTTQDAVSTRANQ